MSAGSSAAQQAQRLSALAQSYRLEAERAPAESGQYAAATIAEPPLAKRLSPPKAHGYYLLPDRQWPGSKNAQLVSVSESTHDRCARGVMLIQRDSCVDEQVEPNVNAAGQSVRRLLVAAANFGQSRTVADRAHSRTDAISDASAAPAPQPPTAPPVVQQRSPPQPTPSPGLGATAS